MSNRNVEHMAKRKAVAEYDILRVAATLLVIIGHSTYYSIVTPYGGCDYTTLTLPRLSVFYRLADYGVAMIYLFHMPLYMALSGALYRKKCVCGTGYSSCKNIVEDKAKKLLIPFIVVTLFFSVPLKYASGYFNFSDNVLRDIVFGQVLVQGNTHLWFLPVLFVIFFVVYLIEKIRLSRKLIILCIFVVSCVNGFIPIAILGNAAYYLLWFYIGYCFEDR